MRPTVLAGVCLLLSAPHLQAQTSASGGDGATRDVRRGAAARIRAEEEAPVVDGRLDEAVWRRAQVLTDFVQREPEPGRPSAFRTEARLAVDDHAVYVAVEAFDDEPGKIVGRLSRRDEINNSDWIAVILDSDDDRRTGYEFFVNPAGVKADGIAANGQDDDLRWDAVWDVAVRRTDAGWTAEFRIPLSQVRFPTHGDGVWGVEIGRIVQRAGETSFWSPVPASDPNFMTYAGRVSGFDGLDPPRRLEVLPYTLMQLRRLPGDAGDPLRDPNDWKLSGGVDVRYGITSNFSLDATINPDFGQVEADPSEVNLTAFESFFAERRPFFVQGADIYRMGLGVGDGDVETLFYSRRIGRVPEGEVDDRGGYARVPDQTSILGAAKLSGRSAGGWTVGALEAVTGEETARVVSDAGARYSDVVEPLTNYAVGRVRKDWRGGATQLGVIGTSVERRLAGTGLEDQLRSRAWTGGVDLVHRFGDGNYRVSAKVLGSRVAGSPAAILATQTSSARYFQRPDNDHAEVDSTATSMAGWSAVTEVWKESGGPWRWAGFFLARSPGFEPNDLGFMRETDQVGGGAYLGYRILSPNRLVRRAGLNLNLSGIDDFGGLSVARSANVNGNAQLPSFWSVYGGLARDFDNWKTDALRGGPAIREPGAWSGWYGIETDDRKPWTLSLDGEWGVEDEGAGSSWNLRLGGEWQAAARTRVSLAPFYGVDRSAWQYVDTPEDAAGEPRYVFADLHQKTFGLTLRLDQTFSPTFSLQLYAQPFVSAGAYSSYKEVVDPTAGAFSDRFRPLPADSGLSYDRPDFDVRQFRSNVVARWEYRPGSTMFFVWSQGRDSESTDPRFRLGGDLDALFGAPAKNVFLVKVDGWINL